MNHPPNILFVQSDQQRADGLGMHPAIPVRFAAPTHTQRTWTLVWACDLPFTCLCPFTPRPGIRTPSLGLKVFAD